MTVRITNDGKQKHSSFEAEVDVSEARSLGGADFDFHVRVTGYGANEAEARVALVHAWARMNAALSEALREQAP